MRPPFRTNRDSNASTTENSSGLDAAWSRHVGDDDTADDAIPTQLEVWKAARARRKHERAEVRRFTRRRRQRRRGLFIGLASVGLLAVLLVVAMFSPLMSVREIRLHGIERLDSQAVTQSLEGIKSKPLAQVTDAEIEEQLRGFVLVQSYHVQRIPPGTVIVHIVERQPVGVVKSGDKHSVVDGAGVTLWEDPAAANSLPIIETEPSNAAAFGAIGQVLTSMPKELLATVGTIKASTADNVEFQLRDGRRVIWGSSESNLAKAEVLQALLTATGGNAKEFDVSSPEQPVTRQ
ncbi:FtsQ-type POTRA domain-containing protein [Gulosibacter bifidus]|uniref:FtsQ-type POTRA domain-containing protein n=1 Tax=Gulosibacter bifidus TaxID=272239 RepID=A0ABW5RI65_9MICO|nr:FtsQ-type POTRA domain-containing protein [Gulosibacter bifidus]